MTQHLQYLSVLKWSSSQYSALKNCSNHTLELIYPLLEIPVISYQFKTETPACSVDDHIRNFGKNLSEFWRINRPVFLDTRHLESSILDDNSEAITRCFQLAEAHGKQVIPVTSPGRSNSYQKAVRSIVKHGLCLRLSPEQIIKNPDIVTQMCSYFQVQSDKVHLVIDYGDISKRSINKSYEKILQSMQLIPEISRWKTFSLCGSSYPATMSQVKKLVVDKKERLEWDIWKKIITEGIERKPMFGDYNLSSAAINKPFRPGLMTVSVTVKYSNNSNWVFVKGLPIKEKDWSQTKELCQNLIAHEEYMDKKTSWGSLQVWRRAHGEITRGAAVDWRSFGVNHHLTIVASQLSNLYEI